MVPHPTRLASQFGLVCASATIGRLLISLAPSLDDLFHEVMQHVLLAARLGPELRRTFAARALDALRELGYPLGPSLQRVVRQALSDQAEASLEMTTTVASPVSPCEELSPDFLKDFVDLGTPSPGPPPHAATTPQRPHAYDPLALAFGMPFAPLPPPPAVALGMPPTHLSPFPALGMHLPAHLLSHLPTHSP